MNWKNVGFLWVSSMYIKFYKLDTILFCLRLKFKNIETHQETWGELLFYKVTL